MPVDPTKNFRRSRKNFTEEEAHDIERKRLRGFVVVGSTMIFTDNPDALGELSCAECHRLKLKCDKKLPCGSCKRRGCESICPLGEASQLQLHVV